MSLCNRAKWTRGGHIPSAYFVLPYFPICSCMTLSKLSDIYSAVLPTSFGICNTSRVIVLAISVACRFASSLPHLPPSVLSSFLPYTRSHRDGISYVFPMSLLQSSTFGGVPAEIEAAPFISKDGLIVLDHPDRRRWKPTCLSMLVNLLFAFIGIWLGRAMSSTTPAFADEVYCMRFIYQT